MVILAVKNLQELQSLKVYALRPKLPALGVNATFMSNKQCKLQQQICYFFSETQQTGTTI